MIGTAPPSGDDPVIASIRNNIVFEKLIVSVLIVAGASAVAHFVIALAVSSASNALTIGAAGTALFNAIGFSCLFFLAGFASALAVGIPLFRLMERAKIRDARPYLAASTVVSLLILAALGTAPSFEAPARLLYVAPGLAASLLFARKMQPFWRAAERAEAPPVATLLH